MPIAMRPSARRAKPFTSPVPAARVTIVRLDANRAPSNPDSTSTRPADATYSESPSHNRPSGVCTSEITCTGAAPGVATR
jgi:hypothetical protein